MIIGKCIDLQNFAQFLQKNCGLNCDAIESRFEVLAVEYAMKNNCIASFKNDKVIFHTADINVESLNF